MAFIHSFWECFINNNYFEVYLPISMNIYMYRNTIFFKTSTVYQIGKCHPFYFYTSSILWARIPFCEMNAHTKRTADGVFPLHNAKELSLLHLFELHSLNSPTCCVWLNMTNTYSLFSHLWMQIWKWYKVHEKSSVFLKWIFCVIGLSSHKE